jgi:hypothetical protein
MSVHFAEARHSVNAEACFFGEYGEFGNLGFARF